MHPIIKEILDRAKVKNPSELRKDERDTYDSLIKDLKERVKPLTIKDWEEFIKEQIEKTIDSHSPDDSPAKKEYLWAQIKLLKNLLVFLQRSERGEKAIKQQFNLEK